MSKLHLKLIVAFIFLILTTTAYAQEFEGVATYKSHRKFDLKIADDDKNSELKKQLHEQLMQQSQREYILEFNREESLYKQVEQLNKPMPAAKSGISISISENSDLYYKHIKEHRFVNQTEIMGKVFLIKDSLRAPKWELKNETKNIGNYTCFKAEFTHSYETQTLTETGEIEKKSVEQKTIAWYTPQIPVSNGPMHFSGLPGLILEINDGDLTLICSKIVINPEDSIDIKEPSKGKEVTQKEFDEIQEKKNAEMMEQFSSKRNGGKATIISIGG